MRIVDIKEATISTGENRSNAMMDFSDMTTGLVAVVTDVSRNGRPVVAMASVGLGGTARTRYAAIG